jgi:hypothetical protein
LSFINQQPTVDIVLPTYIQSPSDNEKFYSSRVEKIANDILEHEFELAKVNEKWIEDWNDFGDDVEELSKDIADKIKEKCKEELNLPRYKLIVQVTIGQKKDQGARVTSRCLWDTSTDRYASTSYQNAHVWVSVLVFGMYTD